MIAVNDPKEAFDLAQIQRHAQVARMLVERDPTTGARLGTRKARGRCQLLMDMYHLGHRHPQMGGAR